MITHLLPNEVFVFGSNLAGRHGKGAALQARLHFGARYGQAVGPQGQSYAIPTKDQRLHPLPLNEILTHVLHFIHHANSTPNKKYLVTEIGCGLAHFSPSQIAPMFRKAPANVILPKSFTNALNLPDPF